MFIFALAAFGHIVRYLTSVVISNMIPAHISFRRNNIHNGSFLYVFSWCFQQWLPGRRRIYPDRTCHEYSACVLSFLTHDALGTRTPFTLRVVQPFPSGSSFDNKNTTWVLHRKCCYLTASFHSSLLRNSFITVRHAKRHSIDATLSLHSPQDHPSQIPTRKGWHHS